MSRSVRGRGVCCALLIEYIKLVGRRVVCFYTLSSLFVSLTENPSHIRKTSSCLVLSILCILPCTFHSLYPPTRKIDIMSFFKKLKSEFEDMFGDDDKKKEERPLQPTQDASESLGLTSCTLLPIIDLVLHRARADTRYQPASIFFTRTS